MFVAAELNLHGALATLYLTNTPRVDVVATSPDGIRTVHIQVKTKGRGSASWQWNIAKAKDEQQAPADECMVLVDLDPPQPAYYVWPLRAAAKTRFKNHQTWLKAKGDQRPRTPDSTHTAIRLAEVEAGKDA